MCVGDVQPGQLESALPGQVMINLGPCVVMFFGLVVVKMICLRKYAYSCYHIAYCRLPIFSGVSNEIESQESFLDGGCGNFPNGSLQGLRRIPGADRLEQRLAFVRMRLYTLNTHKFFAGQGNS